MKSMILEKKHKWIIYLAIFLFFLIWQWNGMLDFSLPTGWDEGAWNLETLASSDNSIDFGKDLAFAIYPSLGWLFKGIFPSISLEYGTVIFQMIIVNFASAFLRTAIIVLFWKNAPTKFSKIIAFLATILNMVMFRVQGGTSQVDLCILVSCLSIYKIHTMLKDHSTPLLKNQRLKIYLLVVSVAILMSIVPLVKFSYISMTLVLFAILIIILVFRKRILEIGVLISTYLISTVGLWILCGEKITLIVPWFKSMFQFLKGYSENWAISFNGETGYTFPQFILFLGFCVAYGIMLLYLFKHDRFYCVAWFIIAPFIFLSFKEGFVRSDIYHVAGLEHSLFYILFYLLFLIKEMEINPVKTSTPIESNESGNKHINYLSVNRYFYPILLILLIIPNVINKGWYPTTTAYTDFKDLKDQERFFKKIEESKKETQNIPFYAKLYEDIQDYPDSTIGMLTEQTFCMAYDLVDRFKIAPIDSVQGISSSYTELTMVDYYSSDEAPDILLYCPAIWDSVSHVNRMGSIIESLLENYHIEKVDEYGYSVLKHDEKDYKTEPYSLGEPQKIKVGESIEVPKVDNAYVFMKVDWDLTPFGSIASFLLKPTQTKMEMTTDNGTVYKYRFLRNLAENGIYVSNWAENSAALADVFKGDTTNNSIKSICFYGDNLFYDKEIEVSFYAVPFSEKQTSYQTVKFEFASDIPSGDYQVFYAQGYNFAEENSKWISVGSGQKSLVAALPSEGWNSFRLDFPPKSGITCDLSSVAIKNQEDVRVNLVTASDIVCEETDGVFRITTTGNDPYIIFSAVNMAEEQNVIIPTSRTEEGACSVDSISNVSGDGFSINGWALDISGIDVPSSVYVSLNKKYYKMEQMVRNDVSETFVNDNLTNSGFGGYISTENLPAGTYPVELIVISADGKSYYSHYVCSVTV